LFKKGEYSKKKDVVEVPFTLENGLIIIPVTIEGETYRFLFDTGAPNVISTELSSKLTTKRKRSFRTSDSQGNQTILDYVSLPKIEIQGASFINMTAAVADLKKTDAIACLGIDGLIGANLMRKASWQIDNLNRVLRIAFDFEKLHLPEGSFVIPFSTEVTGTPVLHLKIGNTDIKKIQMDTGSVGFITTDMDSYKSVLMHETVLAKRSSYGVSSVGLFGTAVNDSIFQLGVQQITLGDLVLENQIVEFKQAKISLLGMAFLKNFLVTIDWSKNLLYLYPQREFHNSFVESFGISIMRAGNQMEVTMITSGSEADKQGLKLGDKVVRLNDIDLHNPTLDDYCRIIKLVRLLKVDHLELEIEKNGETHIVKLNRLPAIF